MKSNLDFQKHLGELPPLPAVAARANALLNDPKATSETVAEVLRQDQAITAKILQVANSSYYAIPGGVDDVRKALHYLGFQTIAQLVLSVSVIHLFKNYESRFFSMSAFWAHGIQVAVGAEALVRDRDRRQADTAFTAGLLHDVGKLAALVLEPKQFETNVLEARNEGVDLITVERRNGEMGHDHVGAALVRYWGIPERLAIPIEMHHSAEKGLDTVTQAVRLANAWVQDMSIPNFEEEWGVEENYRVRWHALVKEKSEEMERLFGA